MEEKKKIIAEILAKALAENHPAITIPIIMATITVALMLFVSAIEYVTSESTEDQIIEAWIKQMTECHR